MTDWRDRIVGARMTVDQEFAPRVAESQFSNQQWGLIMTAVDLEIEHPDDPERAQIVADTSKLPAILPELEKVEAAMGGYGGNQGQRQSGGLLDGIKNLLGGDGGDDQRKAAAESLAQEYAAELQAHLESTGRWEEVRTAADT